MIEDQDMTEPVDPYKRLNSIGKRDAIVQGYLQLDTWTPEMAALLVCGVQAPPGCHQIPDTGIDFYGRPADGLQRARRVLAQWLDWLEDDIDNNDGRRDNVEPWRFLNWCSAEPIETDWLPLFLFLIGNPPKGYLESIPSPLSLLTSGGATTSPAVPSTPSKAAQIADLPISMKNNSSMDALALRIEEAITKAGSTHLADVFLHLREIARSKTLPFTGNVNGALEYLDDYDRKDEFSKDALRKRLKTRAKHGH